MANTFGNALPWPNASDRKRAQQAETTGGGSESTPWIVVAENLNPGEAVIIKGRLESEEIPAIVQQEAVGSVLGLTVGPLGSAKVAVPEPFAERALLLLAETFESDGNELEDDEDEVE